MIWQRWIIFFGVMCKVRSVIIIFNRFLNRIIRVISEIFEWSRHIWIIQSLKYTWTFPLFWMTTDTINFRLMHPILLSPIEKTWPGIVFAAKIKLRPFGRRYIQTTHLLKYVTTTQPYSFQRKQSGTLMSYRHWPFTN